MKRFLRMLLIFAMLFSILGCGVWQCAIGDGNTQSVVIENNGLVLIVIFALVVCLLLAFLAGGVGIGRGGGE